MFWPFISRYPERRVADVAGKSYDYIIVGDPNVSVLVISKGKVKDDWLSSMPIVGNARENYGSDIDTIPSEPDEQWNGVPVRYFASQALGGASIHNGLQYTRGPPANYNHWAALGNDQWSFENIEEAAKDMNLPVRNDINNPDAPPEALFEIEHMITKTGHRNSAQVGYLPKSLVLERQETLTICSGAVATRLQFNQDGTEAIGVYILDRLDQKSAKECLVSANREVIVSCGALFSPQFLMLSGIGPKEQLEQHKIPLVRDMPGVGANLNDHIAFSIAFQVRLADSYIRLLNPLIAIWHLLLFIFTKTGIFSRSGARLCAFLSSENIDEKTMTLKPPRNASDEQRRRDPHLPENAPDVELLFINAAFDYERGKGYCGFQTCLVQPFSRGRIELASSDPLAFPKFYSQFLTDPRDWAVARKAARFAMNYVETFRKSKYPFNSTWHIAPGVQRGSMEGSWKDVSDKEMDRFLRERLLNFYHPTSTCHMGLEKDGAVVGQDLKVHGFKNLRIADASVFPMVTSAHTTAPVYMVAERCADFIKNDWSKESH
ncbi:hypothetical protein COL26b_007294 [Colletotrichum chrysophilum]|uniref:uncharacterized protein n=1 Tax=Colletotrichum chrysophilum TaxID=1836956 RepID=UPI0022FFD548|nr:uncharacterized protein COL26b_007294 [Colletotrichum chrysophilum]KAJ0374532.1 hypothetical protein COL26b_007294 [Colletotrichum chrysophilum]